MTRHPFLRHLVIRADGAPRIGLGHIMRTLSIADALAATGARITYLSRVLPDWAAAQVRGRGHDLHVLDLPWDATEVEDAAFCAPVVADANAVLLDHYGLAQIWTAQIKDQTGLPLAAMDDLAQDPRCVDLLIDPSPGRMASDYDGLIPGTALRLMGPDYAPLRPEFAMAARDTTRADRFHVAVALGGSDPDGVTLTCLAALAPLEGIDVTIILSSAAPALDQVRAAVGALGTRARLLLDCTDMAAVLSGVDLAIGAGGSSALERCVLGLPSILLVLADNQTFNAAALARAGAVVPCAADPDALRAEVLRLRDDAQARAAMARAARALCDGLGAPRVALALATLGRSASLRPATAHDMARVHAWQSEPGARRFARTPEVPDLDSHAAWFARRLARPDPFYIVEDQGQPCGFVRLDQTDAAAPWEVSILIAQAAQGRGLAHAALGLLRLTHPKRHTTAHVHPANTASQRLFSGAGYQRQAGDQFLSLGWAQKAAGDCDAN